MSTQDEAKKAAGRRVIEEFVRDGMKLGLGSGTTSHFFVRELGKHVAGGMKLTCTTTSRSTIDVAREVGIRITEPNEIGELRTPTQLLRPRHRICVGELRKPAQLLGALLRISTGEPEKLPRFADNGA